jgi:hypothetical protein
MKEAARKLRTVIAFARGMLLGFVAAFVVFDLALLRGGTTAYALAIVRYYGWQLFHPA